MSALGLLWAMACSTPPSAPPPLAFEEAVARCAEAAEAPPRVVVSACSPVVDHLPDRLDGVGRARAEDLATIALASLSDELRILRWELDHGGPDDHVTVAAEHARVRATRLEDAVRQRDAARVRTYTQEWTRTPPAPLDALSRDRLGAQLAQAGAQLAHLVLDQGLRPTWARTDLLGAQLAAFRGELAALRRTLPPGEDTGVLALDRAVTTLQEVVRAYARGEVRDPDQAALQRARAAEALDALGLTLPAPAPP
ncbi:MAG: hypothetical protein H6732_07290 [Alphaproteobacteria bacterium]|nr:hypothetical protein [Alphaproteobacteria bacterium]